MCTVFCFCETHKKLLLFFYLFIIQSCSCKTSLLINYMYFSSVKFISYDHSTKCSLQVVTSYSHVTEDEAYVFRLQKLCLDEKVHKLKQLSLKYC